MFASIMQFLGDGVSAVLQWFDMVLDATGMRGFLMAFIFMFLAYKFLLVPFVGRAGVGTADKVTRSKKRRDDDV